VILGLIQLTKQNRFTERKVNFSRYQLIQILGWRHGLQASLRVGRAAAQVTVTKATNCELYEAICNCVEANWNGGGGGKYHTLVFGGVGGTSGGVTKRMAGSISRPLLHASNRVTLERIIGGPILHKTVRSDGKLARNHAAIVVEVIDWLKIVEHERLTKQPTIVEFASCDAHEDAKRDGMTVGFAQAYCSTEVRKIIQEDRNNQNDKDLGRLSYCHVGFGEEIIDQLVANDAAREYLPLLNEELNARPAKNSIVDSLTILPIGNDNPEAVSFAEIWRLVQKKESPLKAVLEIAKKPPKSFEIVGEAVLANGEILQLKDLQQFLQNLGSQWSSFTARRRLVDLRRETAERGRSR
jgi:hypothetical protein